MSDFNIDWIKEYLIKEPKVIFDIGSYDGEDGLKFKKKYPNARVISIEADITNYNRMVDKKERLKDIELYQFAAFDENGKTLFYINKTSINGRRASGSVHKPKIKLFLKRKVKFNGPYKVSTKRIDTFCKEQNIKIIDFIHMDIQGTEYEALEGLGKLRPKLIFLEVSGLNCYEDTKSTEKKLIEMGYKRIKKLPSDELWILKNGKTI